MAFELDFNSSSAEQKVDSLIAKLKTLSNEATAAAEKLTPSNQASEKMKSVASANNSAAEAIKKVGAESDKTSKKVVSGSKEMETGAAKFVKSLETGISRSAHQINAFSGEFGEAAQSMARANQSLKQQANELANAEKNAQTARISQAKQTNTQLVAEERLSAENRSRNWTEYYTKQDAQIKRYETSLQKSKQIWANADLTRQRRLAQEMSRLANQTMREEIASLNQRSAAWTSYYAKQEAQIARYRSAIAQSRTIVANATSSNIKAMQGTAASINVANQAAAGFRATLAGMGMGFGIYTGSTIAFAASMYTLAKGITHALRAGAEFEKSMYRVYAVTSQMGTTYEKNGNLYVSTSDRIAESQNKMAEAAINASKVTVFTAGEAAEGMVALGMAGLKANAVMGALTPSLQLAQIGMIDVYESADIMTNVMLGFGMSIETTEDALKSATHVTDVLASAITNSNSTIKEMSQALSYVAPIAAAAGGSIEETVAILETFHNVGIKGQRAGTAMRRAYVNLMEPTEKVSERIRDLGVSTRDTNGNMRDMIDIMVSLKEAGADAGDMVTIFGVRAAPAMIALNANLSSTVAEINRLKTEAEGAGKAMADFMATSTSEQWRIINSKIQAQFIQAFRDAKPAVNELNYALFDLVENDLSGFFNTLSAFISATATGTATLINKLRELNALRASEAAPWYLKMIPKLSDMTPLTALYNKQKAIHDLMQDMYSDSQTPAISNNAVTDFLGFFSGMPSDMPGAQLFRSLEEAASSANKEIGTGILMTEEMAAELSRAANSDAISRLEAFAKLEAEILKDSSFAAAATSARREAAVNNEITKYQEKLGLISQETALESQIAELERAKLAITERHAQETEKNNEALERIKASNQGIAADGEAYAIILRKQSQLNDQHLGQYEQINAELSKTKLIAQEALLNKNGFKKLTEDVDQFREKLVTANEKLKGNTEATEENTLANFHNALAKRTAWQQTSEFTKLTAEQQKAFEMETEAIRDQLPAIDELIAANKALKASKKDETDLDKLSREFGRGKGMDSNSKAIMEYKTALDTYERYLANKDELMREYGLSEVEFNQMITDSKMEASQKLWDSQHEHLAKWRDDWSKTIADQMEKYIFAEQSWKETVNNMSRHMLGTMINTFIRVGAEQAANHVMRMVFTKQEMAADSAVAANKVAAEGAKQAAVATTAATESMSMAAGIAQFTQMLGLGPALAAAWAPAAMYINIASFGSAGVAASASMALAGAITMAAGAAASAVNVSGARQFGGGVTAGNSYLVGETGRELFIPEVSGRIISNQELSSSKGGGSPVVMHITNQYSIDAKGNEQIEERLERALAEAADRGHQKVIEDLNNYGVVAQLVQKSSRL